jgi:Protein of unknown function (DUF1592)/Protein of unknown function (DUF1588)/Protein of unknown function (DUF1595)/Protein of unknown function (DUF1587)
MKLPTSRLLVLTMLMAGCTAKIVGNGDGSVSGLPSGPGLNPDGTPTTDPSKVVEGTTTPDGVGWVSRFPKLSNAQWEASVQDIFYLEAPTGQSGSFTPEPADGGYENEAAAGQTVAGDAWVRYQLGAEEVAKLVTADAKKLDKLVPSSAPSDAAGRARATIVDLGLRTYRRPLSTPEADAYVALFDKGAALDAASAFASGMRLVIQTMLQSPHFLYRVESSSQPDGPRIWLNGYELATRLSYAIWNTTPPKELLDAAGAGQLATPEGLKTRATSMLADSRAATALGRFHQQTFRTSVFGSQSKDARFAFDSTTLAPALQEESRLFFADIVAAGGGIREILTKPVAYVNEQTAPFYGLTGITGTQLQKVELDPARRAGLLTQVGFLAQTANRTLTDPVHRGLAVLRQVLCDDPDPPPPIDIKAPSVPPGVTTRETYEKATACGVGCHDTLINPPGFAFEHFDTVGRWRDDESGLPINVAGTFGARVGWSQEGKRTTPPIMLKFDGAVDLLTQVAALERTHECYARHLLEFVLAKPVTGEELGAGALLGKTSKSDGAAQGILGQLVTLNTFRARAPDPQ